MKKRVSIEVNEKMIDLINKARERHSQETSETLSFAATINKILKSWLEMSYGEGLFKGPFDVQPNPE
jgi:hypothetical protein